MSYKSSSEIKLLYEFVNYEFFVNTKNKTFIIHFLIENPRPVICKEIIFNKYASPITLLYTYKILMSMVSPDSVSTIFHYFTYLFQHENCPKCLVKYVSNQSEGLTMIIPRDILQKCYEQY